MTTCHCGTPIRTRPGPGRPARHCSNACRQRYMRTRRRLPAALTDRSRWTRHVAKRPVQLDGSPASSTNPSTWTTYLEAAAATTGDGLGIMLGDGLGCWDFDHCLTADGLTADVAALVASISAPLWVERSLSGDGLHVFVAAPEGPGRRRTGVEFYSRARFIVVTGDRFTP